MKRTLSILLVLVLTMLVMSSCTLIPQFFPKEEEATCQHEYTTEVTAPTCTAKGYSTYTCKHCQKSFSSDETEMLAHNYVEGVCSACGATDPDYVPPHTHNFVEGKCECGETDPNYVPPHTHEFVDGKCECGETDPDYVAPCEHEYEQVVGWHPLMVAADCVTPGVDVYICNICGDTKTEETPIDPEAHAFWGEEEIVIEADCALKTDGLKMVSCANEGCTATQLVDVYYSDMHEWDVKTEVYPTCTSDGEYYAVCTLCGEVDSYVMYSEGHYNWYMTCGDTGTCMECGEEFTINHNTEDYPATCTTPAYCTNCWSDVGEALGHSYEGAYCSACGEMNTEKYEEVQYSLNISDLEVGTRTEDDINGMFTILSGTEIRNRSKTFDGVAYSKSVKIGSNSAKIKVNVPGSGVLTFLVQNGSSGVDMQFITVTAPDGTVYNIEFVAGVESNPVVKIELEVTEGEWIISRGKNGGTQDVFALWLDCVVEKSEENGFELVADGKVDYLIGDTLNFTGVRLNSTFSNGKTEPIAAEDITIDHGAVDISVSGTYPILVYYKDYEPITYYVNVYAPESIELGFDAIEKIANNSYGNGVYYNHSFRELYFIGEELDLSGLTVTVIGKCGDDTLKFIVTDYTVTGFDSTSADFLDLTISANGLTATVAVHMTDAEPTPNENGVYQLLVDPDYQGLCGLLSGPYHVFNTIQAALDFADRIDLGAAKELTIAPGYYNEKLEITVPNLHIIGIGDTPDEVVIEWNSIYGQLDASGFSHVTDSTATVAIRESAHNVTIENITISNYWNSQDRMDAAGLEIERGLALLVQADQFIMKNSKLLGIQDTLELFTGRQYFENVFISGYTDFIFGTNNTTLFKNCTIHVIDTAKDDNGTAGYITAFKGSNKGANDSIVYGAIFDGCKFTADAGVMNGCTAIGRTWGAYAAVAVINSELGAHISLAGYSSNKNERYVSMNGKPTDATVQFVEFNNTGAGALTEAVAGMRFLTAEEAALYTNMAVIFGTINGNVTYLDAWMPGNAPTADDRTYYYFNGTEGDGESSHSYADNIQGTVTEWAGLTIDTTAGKLTARDSDTQFNQGAKIIFNVEAGTLVTVISYPGYGYYTINGVAHNANDTFSMYFANASEVVIEATATSYLHQLIINPAEAAPVAPTLNEIKVSGVNANYNVGDAFDLSGAVVKAYYSDFSVITVTDYIVDASAVNNQAAGSYEVVFTYGGASAILTVNYEGPNADPAITESTVLDFTSEDGYNAVVNNSKVQLDGSFRNNGAEYQVSGTITFMVKAGTCITVIPFSNTSYVSYTIGALGETDLPVLNEMHSIMFHEDCIFVYTGLDNNYLCQIVIETPLADGKYVFGNAADEGDVTGITSTIPSMNLSGEFKTHSGGAQMNENSQIIFTVPALTTVTVKGYDANYGQLEIYADGVVIPMQGDGFYVFTTTYATTVMINAHNAGTEEAPDWSKSYITYIEVDNPDFITEDVTVNFGSEGNYNTLEQFDFSGITIGDNGGNNAQIKNGSFTFALKKGATLIINGYPGYTDYNLIINDLTFTNITEDNFTYELDEDSIITILHDGATNGNNYFYSFSVTYPAGGDVEEPTPDEPKEPVTYVFDSTLDHEAMDQGAKADGDTATFADGFFTIHYSAKTKVDGSKKNFDDSYTATQRLSMGGKTSIGSIVKNAIEFTTDEAATVTIWWVCGGDGREIEIFDANGNVIMTSTESCVKNSLYITTFELTEGGTYYIGCSKDSNYYFKVEVTVG